MCVCVCVCVSIIYIFFVVYYINICYICVYVCVCVYIYMYIFTLCGYFCFLLSVCLRAESRAADRNTHNAAGANAQVAAHGRGQGCTQGRRSLSDNVVKFCERGWWQDLTSDPEDDHWLQTVVKKKSGRLQQTAMCAPESNWHELIFFLLLMSYSSSMTSQWCSLRACLSG